RTSLWIENDDGWIVPRALFGHNPEERESVSARRYEARTMSPAMSNREPFVLNAGEIAEMVDDPLDPAMSYAIAPLDVEGRGAFIVATAGRRPLRRPRAPPA